MNVLPNSFPPSRFKFACLLEPAFELAFNYRQSGCDLAPMPGQLDLVGTAFYSFPKVSRVGPADLNVLIDGEVAVGENSYCAAVIRQKRPIHGIFDFFACPFKEIQVVIVSWGLWGFFKQSLRSLCPIQYLEYGLIGSSSCGELGPYLQLQTLTLVPIHRLDSYPCGEKCGPATQGRNPLAHTVRCINSAIAGTDALGIHEHHRRERNSEQGCNEPAVIVGIVLAAASHLGSLISSLHTVLVDVAGYGLQRVGAE
ncbi:MULTISPECIES: hypothetical protein [unclassified Ensifer]|uniref:hypothetical protein n=1 Tax=unclassified Ensifer TaxID=2633371 RepID=UPI000A7B36BB|nr:MULTISPECIES: hypothetical protein [unclassified Ensifer]